MQSINSFKNIQNLGKQGSKGTGTTEGMNGLESLEQGLFAPQGKNEFQTELSKNINLSDLKALNTKNSELPPELAADLAQTKTEVLQPTLRKSGIITHNSQRDLGAAALEQSKQAGQPGLEQLTREEFLTQDIKQKTTLESLLNKDEPKSIFTRNLDAEVKAQKPTEFVHKSMLKPQADKIDFQKSLELPQEKLVSQNLTSDSENLINLRNMSRKANTRSLNGTQFNTGSTANEGLIKLNGMADSNMEREAFSHEGESAMDFMGQQHTPMSSDVGSSEKVFSMSALAGLDTTNNSELINKISDYITNSKIESSNEVQMTVSDDQLGQIDLRVEKAADKSINIVMNTSNQEANVILNQNKGELMSSLTNSGFTVSDIKVDMSSAKSNNNSDFSQNFSQNQNQQQFGSKQNQQDQESQKRSQLWEMLRDKEAA